MFVIKFINKLLQNIIKHNNDNYYNINNNNVDIHHNKCIDLSADSRSKINAVNVSRFLSQKELHIEK